MRRLASYAGRTALGLTLGFGLGALAAGAEAQTLVIAGSGGAAQAALDVAYDEPFTAETGIQIQTVEPWSLAKIKTMVESGNVEWDASELDGPAVVLAVQSGYLEPIDWSKVDPDKVLPDFAKLEHAFVPSVYSTIYGYRTDKFATTPSTWADFWDVETFPGGRALQNTPQVNLEIALIADGVSKEQVYDVLATEEGVERAFAKLDEIKPHIVKWWVAGAEPPQMLSSGEVVMSSAWNGRITTLKREGGKVDIAWTGAMNFTYMVIVKGTKHKTEVERYFASYLIPERAAEYARQIPYPGFVPGLEQFLEPEIVAELPTVPGNIDGQFPLDDAFWAANLGPLMERWNTWLLE